MNKFSCMILSVGLVLTILMSNIGSFIKDGRELDNLRNSVLRLHILANSDSANDQKLKLMVRDSLLENSDSIFGDADSLEEAEKNILGNLEGIVELAEETLKKNGCTDKVSAELANVYFDERIYGDITMPEGEYKALRLKIGSAQGKNWWCVMYPPLCIPAACCDVSMTHNNKAVQSLEEVNDNSTNDVVLNNKKTEEIYFDETQQDILYHPEKYEVRFAVWDKFKSLIERIS